MTNRNHAAGRRKAEIALGGWRALLTHVEPRMTPHLRAAADLARRCDAMLIGVGAQSLDPNLLPYEGWNEPAFDLLREDIRKDLAAAETTFREAAASVRSEWQSRPERPASALALVARAADLIVAGATAEDGYRRADPAELALLSGRPVLVVPASGRGLRGESVLVAWKDTREARRALADALPLLVAADDVLVLEVCEDGAHGDAEGRTAGVIEGLRRHGVEARARVISTPNSNAGALIEAEAREAGADLIVSGCYGHSRLGEWLFGGVTRHLLASPDRFLLISH